MEESVFIVKPDGMQHCAEILEMIGGNTGLSIVSSALVELTESALARLYPDLEKTGEIWKATVERMAGQKCLMGIVEGENAIEKLLELCGRATDPRQCAPLSIRARFGTSPLYNWEGKFVYFPNVIHRSKNPDEVVRDLELYTELRRTPTS